MRRIANVYMKTQLAGKLQETEQGYTFEYLKEYLIDKEAQAVSLTLPLRSEVYQSNILFPFFDGLIPEGWLLDIAERNWKLNEKDRMGLLLACCKDCIGAVSIEQL
jgi:serine/threonine-protein kinase HipA